MAIREEKIPALLCAGERRLHLEFSGYSPYSGHRQVVHQYPMVSQPQDWQKRALQKSAVVVETSFHNHTHRTLSFRQRSGLPVALPPVISQEHSTFIVRKLLKLERAVLDSVILGINAQVQIEDAELFEIRKHLEQADRNAWGEICLVIDYHFSAHELEQRGGTIYHHESDTLISIKSTAEIEAHPCSAQFLNNAHFGRLSHYGEQPEFNFKLRYVNHDPKARPKYINLLGKVYVLYPQRDAPARMLTVRSPTEKKNVTKLVQDYVQIFFSSRNDPDSGEGAPGYTPLKLSLEEAQHRWGMYDSFEQAVAQGNTDAMRKEILAKQAADLEQLRNQMERELLLEKRLANQAAADAEREKRETVRLNGELSRLEIELKTEKARVEARLLELDNERKIIDHIRKEHDERLAREKRVHEELLAQQRARFEREREEWQWQKERERAEFKDKMEQRSAHRKDWSEGIKFLPAVVMCMGAAFLALQKLFASQPQPSS